MCAQRSCGGSRPWPAAPAFGRRPSPSPASAGNLAAGAALRAAIVAQYFRAGISGIVLVGVFAAIMSTGVACINCCAANVSVDIYKDRIKPNATDASIKGLGIVSSLAVGIVGALLAWWKYNVIDLLLLAFTFQASSLFFPTVLGVFWRKPTSKASFVSMVVSLGVVLLWLLGSGLHWGSLFSVDALWPGLASSGIVFVYLLKLVQYVNAKKTRVGSLYYSQVGLIHKMGTYLINL